MIIPTPFSPSPFAPRRSSSRVSSFVPVVVLLSRLLFFFRSCYFLFSFLLFSSYGFFKEEEVSPSFFPAVLPSLPLKKKQNFLLLLSLLRFSFFGALFLLFVPFFTCKYVMF